MLFSVRGAVTVSDNQAAEIEKALATLIEPLLAQNKIAVKDMTAVFFTVTPDLSALNPATAVRRLYPDWSQVALLCSQEPVIDGMLPGCIRVLIQWQCEEQHQKPIPVYLGQASQLRPDLC